MTQQEKKMNKDDLIAYKIHDNTQYSMIPGVSNKKNYLQRDQAYKSRLNPESP